MDMYNLIKLIGLIGNHFLNYLVFKQLTHYKVTNCYPIEDVNKYIMEGVE